MPGGRLDTRGSSINARAWRFVAVSIGLCIAAWLLDGWPTAAALAVVAIGVLQGLRLGAVELAGFALATVLALFIAAPLGRSIEPVVSALTGLTGLAKRAVCLSIVVVSILAVGGVAGRVVLRRLVDQDSPWRRRNSLLGAAIGLVQSILLVAGLMWAILAVRPVAQARLEPPAEDAGAREHYVRRQNSAAELVVAVADALAHTTLGLAAASTNPLTTLEIFEVARAFAEVSRDPYALKWLLASEPMARLRKLESYNQAASLASGDRELMGFFTDEGIDAQTLTGLATNDTILQILDETTIAADIEPIAPSLLRAVYAARDQIGRGPPELLDHIDDHSPGMR